MGVGDIKLPSREVAVNLRPVPRAVRDLFKSYCSRRGYTMTEALIALMKEAYREDKPLTFTDRA